MTNTMTKEEIMKGIREGQISFLKVASSFNHEEQSEKFRRVMNAIKFIPQLESGNPLDVVIVIPVEFYGQLLMLLAFGLDAKDCSIQAEPDNTKDDVYQVLCTTDRYFPITNLPVFEKGETYTAKARHGILYAESEVERYVIAIEKNNDWMNDPLFAEHFKLV